MWICGLSTPDFRRSSLILPLLQTSVELLYFITIIIKTLSRTMMSNCFYLIICIILQVKVVDMSFNIVDYFPFSIQFEGILPLLCLSDGTVQIGILSQTMGSVERRICLYLAPLVVYYNFQDICFSIYQLRILWTCFCNFPCPL